MSGIVGAILLNARNPLIQTESDHFAYNPTEEYCESKR